MSTKAEILKQREAYVQGVKDRALGYVHAMSAATRAERMYPLPMIEKPRVVVRTLSNSPLYNTPREIHLSIKNGKLVHGWGTCVHAGYDTFATLTKREEGKFTADDVRLIAEAYAELLKQPTELVEDASE